MVVQGYRLVVLLLLVPVAPALGALAAALATAAFLTSPATFTTGWTSVHHSDLFLERLIVAVFLFGLDIPGVPPEGGSNTFGRS
jgi:hypothetical protein